MNDTPVKPVRLSGLMALRWGLRFARDPLMTTSRAFEALGPLVMLADGLPLIRPARAVMLGVPLVLTAGAAFQRELLSDTATWRGASLLPGGPRGSAARRMSSGLTRLTGPRHAHYRKLVLQPLRRNSVQTMAEAMGRLAAAHTASWPVGEWIDLWEYLRRMMRSFALELLFGGDDEQSRSIADLVSRLMERKWDWSAFAFPINLPITTYGQIVRDAEVLERRILDWTAAKRGQVDDRELAAIIVNSSDADGKAPDDAAIVGQLASLFAAASEASHSALMWTLLLLVQHPRVAAHLLDELKDKLGGPRLSWEEASELPYLDAVVKESMRILPPVPLQIRVAQCDATIAGHPVPKGTRVMLNTFLNNRMPELYPEGNVFRPERWFTIVPTMFEFPVFSAGPHSCPGYWFGATAVKVALAAILSRYRIDLASDARIDYRVQPTLRPRQRVPVLLHVRDGTKFAAKPISGTIRNLVKFPH
jgi:cytochrome P450